MHFDVVSQYIITDVREVRARGGGQVWVRGWRGSEGRSLELGPEKHIHARRLSCLKSQAARVAMLCHVRIRLNEYKVKLHKKVNLFR